MALFLGSVAILVLAGAGASRHTDQFTGALNVGGAVGVGEEAVVTDAMDARSGSKILLRNYLYRTAPPRAARRAGADNQAALGRAQAHTRPTPDHHRMAFERRRRTRTRSPAAGRAEPSRGRERPGRRPARRPAGPATGLRPPAPRRGGGRLAARIKLGNQRFFTRRTAPGRRRAATAAVLRRAAPDAMSRSWNSRRTDAWPATHAQA